MRKAVGILGVSTILLMTMTLLSPPILSALGRSKSVPKGGLSGHYFYIDRQRSESYFPNFYLTLNSPAASLIDGYIYVNGGRVPLGRDEPVLVTLNGIYASSPPSFIITYVTSSSYSGNSPVSPANRKVFGAYVYGKVLGTVYIGGKVFSGVVQIDAVGFTSLHEDTIHCIEGPSVIRYGGKMWAYPGNLSQDSCWYTISDLTPEELGYGEIPFELIYHPYDGTRESLYNDADVYPSNELEIWGCGSLYFSKPSNP